tara:strand:- start:4026 stop:4871 length:846 start_codon:yes stop_codon:yes gene_type:complete
MNVIGLGQAGCNIAKLFEKYSYYNVILFDSVPEYKNMKNHYFIPKQASVELYDANPINVRPKMNGDEIMFFVCGSGKVSGCTLWLLEQFKNKKITVYYIIPEVELLDNKAKLRNKAHLMILQQYARSGMFDRICLIENRKMKEIIGKVSIIKYYQKMNDYLVNIIHMLNVFKNTDTAFDTFQQNLNTCRITTISAYDIDNKEEKTLFSLKNINQIKYFFGINRLRIEEDENLIDEVTSISTTCSSSECLTSYGIFETSYDHDICFVVKSTAEIQNINMEER